MRLRPPAVSSIIEALLLRAVDTPDALAFDCRGERLSWGGLLEEALRGASALAAAGLGPGMRCAIALPTSTDFLRAFFGAQLLGAVPVALNPKLPVQQLARRIDELDCALTVGDPSRLLTDAAARFDGPLLGRADLGAATSRPRRSVTLPSPDDLSHLQVTSGTTGAPRAAMLTHHNVLASAEALFEHHALVSSDVMVCWLPLHHDLGLIEFVLNPIFFGSPCHLVESSMLTLPTWLATMSRVTGSITAAPDFVYRVAGRMVRSDAVDLRALRLAISGGEVVKRLSMTAFETHFGTAAVIYPGYGLAEATLGVAVRELGAPIEVDGTGAVSCGTALKNIEIRIAAADGHESPRGEPGRILVRGPVVFAGYFNDPAGTADVLQDGWLDTGDVGIMNAAGALFVRGRTRAMIKRAGATIAPREIEEVAEHLAGVRRAAAVGISPPNALTEELVIVVEIERSRDTHESAQVKQAVSDRIQQAVGFVPYDVVLVAPGAIPRTATGKIQYGILKQRFSAHD